NLERNAFNTLEAYQLSPMRCADLSGAKLAGPRRTASPELGTPRAPASSRKSAKRDAADIPSSGIGRARRGAFESVITPPPIVASGDAERSTKRSPARAITGSSSTIFTGREVPAFTGVLAATTRALTSDVARWKRTLVRGRS